MKASVVLQWLAAALICGCDGQPRENVTSAPQDRPKKLSLQVAMWQPVQCNVLFEGENFLLPLRTIGAPRISYMSGPKRGPYGTDCPILITAFAWPGNYWIGFKSDLYVERKDGFIGMKITVHGLNWRRNFAKDYNEQPLDKEIDRFEHEVSGDEVIEAYLRCVSKDSIETKFADVIPPPYVDYFTSYPPGSQQMGLPQFVSAEMDGELLKLKLSDFSRQMVVSMWVDLDSKKAVKAENWEWYPSEQERERVKRIEGVISKP